MPRPDLETPKTVSRLLTSVEDFLGALPSDEEHGNEDWAEIPVDLETWLSSPRYMNLDVTLSPIQLEALQAMDDPNPETNQYTEYAIQWGKGAGKDFVVALAALRQVYFLLCMRNCYEYYGMARNTGIQLVNVAYTIDQAKHVYFKQLSGLLKGSAWFRNKGYRSTRDRILFPNVVEVVSAAADGDSVEGQNMFFAVMDEASAFRDTKVINAVARAEGVKPEKAADAIYNVLRSSTRSRFPSVGKVVMISYPRYRDDFIQQKCRENAESPGGWTSGPYSTWEVNPRVTRESLEEDYKLRPEVARSMYDCDPPYAQDPYVAFPSRFIECVANSAKVMPDLIDPITDLGTYDPMFKGMPGRYYAIHVDLALKKDRCALALARQGEPVMRSKCPCGQYNWAGIEACMSCGRPEARWLRQELPTMVVTLLKSFAPTENQLGAKEVQFSDVREEIMWLVSRGHKVWSLTYDGWQSADSIQTMRKQLGTRKIRARYGKPGEEKDEELVNVYSVDRTTEAHDTLREFIYDGRFYITPPPDVKKVEDWDTSEHPVAIAFREWRILKLVNGKKVDHPLGAGKDFIDALAGAAYWITQMPLVRNYNTVVRGWREIPPKTTKRAESGYFGRNRL